MSHYIARKFFLSLGFVFTLAVSACGGGAEEPPWPQPVAFTDLLGTQIEWLVSVNVVTYAACQTCITFYKDVHSSTEIDKLFPGEKASNGIKLSDLPIDYNSKMAVVLEDKGSKYGYQYTVQKVEESANAVTISVLKCAAFVDLYGLPSTIYLGVLLPKTDKPIQVLTVQSGKPTLPEYQPNGLGAC